MHPQNLLHLPVSTKSGQHLGKVVDVLVDTDEFRILQIIVRAATPLNLISREHCINRQQIISVTREKIIVEDAVVRSSELAQSPNPV